jgi:hypothetical protein
LRTYEAGETGALQAKENEEAALREVAVLKMQLHARDEDVLKMESAFENKTRDLRRGEGEALNGRRRGKENTEKFEEFLSSSVHVARQRMMELQKAHNRLIRRYTELQDKYLELKAAAVEEWAGDEPLLSGTGERRHRLSTQLQEDEFQSTLDIGPGLGEDVQDELRKRNNGMWNTEVGSSAEPSSIAGRMADLDSNVVRSTSHSPTEIRSPLGGGHGPPPLGTGRGSTDSEGSINASGNSRLKIRSQNDGRVFGRGIVFTFHIVQVLVY